MNEDMIFQYEEKKLKETIELINKKIKAEEDEFSKQEHFIIGFKEGMRGTQFTRESLMSLHATEAEELKRILANPYFGRFEFQNKKDNKVSEIYIGKKLITDLDSKVIVHDWRSPICSMYYDYNIGPAKYIVHGQTEYGDILSKRQIIISDGKLKNVTEVDTLSNDEMLLKYLTEESSARLKSIIATIQKEQNKIIRSPLNNDYIIEGVAGSGKTTVALHRIAYLLYNEAKNISPSEFMILGPNKYFLDYISLLLPDLDIKNIRQLTFDELAMKLINCKFKLEDKNETLRNVLNGMIDEEIIRFKSSIDYLNLIEKFINLYVKAHLKDDIVYEGIVICKSEKLKYIYSNMHLKSSSSYSQKTKDFIKYLTKEIKENYSDLAHQVWLQYRDEFLSLPKDNPRRQEILDITNKIQDEIKKGCPNVIREYFKFIKTNPFILYQTFIENVDKLDLNPSFDINQFKEWTLSKLNKKKISYEDLPALLYISKLMTDSNEYANYKHLIIDEAQDLSMAQYYLLKKIFPKAHMDIYGDPAQAIYDYQATNDFSKLNNDIFKNEAQLLSLNKSYRTTLQISDTANLILDYINREQTDCIAREGENINVRELLDIKDIIYQIQALLSKEYKSIAIICKDIEEVTKLSKSLKKYGIDIHIIKEENDKYNSGLCILPSYLAKGLEFDAVILSNANNINYQDNIIDMKLLYVSITRAMHELYINYTGSICSPLSPLVKNKNKIKSISKDNGK